MPQMKWPPSELFPKAKLIADRIGKNRNVTGVAVTGSLARLELARDIDLVVFHNSAFKDGLARSPERPEASRPVADQYDCNNLDFSSVPNYQAVIRIRRNVPLDLIFVREEILWDCAYLELLGKSERFPEFYKRVFCNIPLLLLGVRRHSPLEKFTENLPVKWLEVDYGLSHPSCKVMHTCQNPACKPTTTWEQLRAEIEKRKAGM